VADFFTIYITIRIYLLANFICGWFFHYLYYCNLKRRMKNHHFYFIALLIQISAVGLILRETPTTSCYLAKIVKISEW